MINSKKNNQGFSLIELIVVSTLLILVAGIGVIGLRQGVVFTRDARRERDMTEVQKALELYYETYRTYPSATSMTQLLNNSNFQDYMQSRSVVDPLNTGVYRYTVNSSANNYSICYYKEATSNQECLTSIGK